ncbi:protein of unknown function [Candidatus Methylomirabilis oxygeniifera]|uniref:Uncharacterized protein n=1 Tax=Methylomirabilis oxygeniifera TaxID=671143 RepID=D5MN74_METO1|nr:protein of unknown function [Candidatus Methylomirabilis oxyfera]
MRRRSRKDSATVPYQRSPSAYEASLVSKTNIIVPVEPNDPTLLHRDLFQRSPIMRPT